VDSLSFMAYMAVILPALALIGFIRMWPRWKAPVGAKIVVVIAVFGLLVPGTCFGLGMAGEALHIFKPVKF
jgi:hypothetical protein